MIAWPALLLRYVDGNWFDIATFLLAVTLAAAKCVRYKHRFVSQKTARNLLHGIAIFPLLMLAISVFSKEILEIVARSNPLILTVAGAVALLSILEDELTVETGVES